MNSSVYEKTIKDPERRVDIKLVSRWEALDSPTIGRKAYWAKTLFQNPIFIVQLRLIIISIQFKWKGCPFYLISQCI